MPDNIVKKVKIVGETVRVHVTLPRRRLSKDPKHVFYTRDALAAAKEAHPKLVIGKVVKPHTLNNFGDVVEGEWIFELVKKKVDIKSTKTARKSVKEARQKAKKEEEAIAQPLAAEPSDTSKEEVVGDKD